MAVNDNPPPRSVLFACGLNSIRSPMAAHLFGRLIGPSVAVRSAGVQTAGLDPFAVAAMAEVGIDIAGHRPVTFEELEELDGLDSDLIVTLSPKAHHKALELTHRLRAAVEYWPTPDPSVVEGSREQRMHAYRELREQLSRRILERFGPLPGVNECAGACRCGCEKLARPLSVLVSISQGADTMIGRPKLVLASGSPRRLGLINQAGIEPDALRPADIDEVPKRGELPRALATRLARGKAEAALNQVRLDEELRGSYIVAADTVVAVGRRILPKAELLDEAAQCLRLLSGRNHRVFSGVCLVTPKETFRQRLVETRVRFKRLSDEDIEAYLASGEWRGKAGGYAAQGIAGSFIVKLVGSYSNVVGLPLYETVSLLSGEGFPIRHGWLSAATPV